MSTLTRELPLYDSLIDLLTETADLDRLQAFRLDAPTQRQLDQLLERNREGTLTSDEQFQLTAFERFEHIVRMLKIRARQKKRGR